MTEAVGGCAFVQKGYSSNVTMIWYESILLHYWKNEN